MTATATFMPSRGNDVEAVKWLTDIWAWLDCVSRAPRIFLPVIILAHPALLETPGSGRLFGQVGSRGAIWSESMIIKRTYSLRVAAVAVALLCVILAITARDLRFAQSQHLIESFGGQVEWVKQEWIVSNHSKKLPSRERYCRVVIDASWRGGRDRLNSLLGLYNLQELEISDAPGIDNSDSIPLTRLSRLRQLHLVGVSVAHIEDGAAATLGGLEELTIADARVGAQALEVIARLPRLRSLALYEVTFGDGEKVFNPRLERLDLSKSSIGDDDLASVSELRRLRDLLLPGTSITDKAFETLSSVPLRDPDPDIFVDLSAVFTTAYERAKFFRRVDYQATLPAFVADADRPWVQQLVARRG